MKKEENLYLGSRFENHLKEKFKNPEFKIAFDQARLKRKLSQKTRTLMKLRKMSIRKLAQKMDTNISQVQRLINEENVSIDTLVRFATAIGKKLVIEYR